MAIKDAITLIAEYIRNTGTPVSEAVRVTWDRLEPFSDEEKQTLMIEALASRINPLLNNPIRASYNQEVSITVTSTPMPLQRHEVTCQILNDIIYHVNGKAKSIASFTKYDVSTKIDSVRLIEEGVIRHRKMWEYIHERLTSCKKSKVEDLGEGERTKIARMVFDLRHYDDSKRPLELA